MQLMEVCQQSSLPPPAFTELPTGAPQGGDNPRFQWSVSVSGLGLPNGMDGVLVSGVEAPSKKAAKKLAALAWLAAAELPLVREIFALFATGATGMISKDNYKRYLQGIGNWGAADIYTDDGWDKHWPEECKAMECTAEGITKDGFEAILYGKFRLGQAQADLDSCKAFAEGSLAWGCRADGGGLGAERWRE